MDAGGWMKKAACVFAAACVLSALSCERWQPPPVRIGICPWPGYEIVRLAHEKGFFRQEGLAVQILKRGGTLETRDDFIEGKIDAAALPLFEAVGLMDAGAEAVIPLVLDYSRGSDGVVIRKSLAGFNGIKGQKVGVTAGTVNSYLLHKALEKHGMSESDVEIIDIVPDEMVEAFADGTVHALSTWEPYLSKAAREGDGVIPFTSRDLSSPIVDVLVVRRDFARRRPADVKRMIRAWFRTIAYFKNNYPEAVQVLADIDGTPADVIKAGFEGVQIGDLTVNRESFGDGVTFGSLFASLDEVVNYMRAKKMITGDADFKKSVQPQFFFESQ